MRLTKHQALGNDFLVLLDLDDSRSVRVDEVRDVCDRHRGIGADGLIRVCAGGDAADVTMELFNADGGRAEMSGNGIRCLAQAVLQAGIVAAPTISVMTDAGRKIVTVDGQPGPRTHLLSVDMGAVKVGDEEPEWLSDDVIRAVRVDAGNPHLVLHVPDADSGPGLAEGLGRDIDASTPGGVNVNFMTPGPGAGEITVRTWERGAGATLACGTGACAAAAAAHAWELTGQRITVHMPGGAGEVVLDDTVTLRGPAVSIATVEWPFP
jgi:diaminopimelate epimerase